MDKDLVRKNIRHLNWMGINLAVVLAALLAILLLTRVTAHSIIFTILTILIVLFLSFSLFVWLTMSVYAFAFAIKYKDWPLLGYTYPLILSVIALIFYFLHVW